MKALAIVLILAATVTGQEPTESDLRSKVADIAALSLQTDNSLQAIRARLAGIETELPSLRSRIEQLENRVFQVTPIAPPVVEVAGPVFQTPPQFYTPVIQSVVPTVIKQVVRQRVTGGRTFKTPVRSFLGRLLRRRFVTIGNSRSSGDWTWPGDLDAHLQGPPHYVSAYELSFMSFRQKVDRHNQDHGG